MKNKQVIAMWAIAAGFVCYCGAAWAQVAAPATAKDDGTQVGTSIFDDYFKQVQQEWDQEAMAKANAAIAKNPKDARAYDTRGYFFFKGKKYDEALKDFQRAATLDPKSTEPHIYMAELYSERKVAAKALAEYNKAVALDAPGTDALYRRADYFQTLGREAEMLADYATIIQREPKIGRAYRQRGQYFLRQNQYDKALSDFNKLIELKPNDADYYLLQGQALRGLGQTDDAFVAFFKIHELDPKREVPVYELGLTYLKSQSYDLALENFNKDLAANDQRVLSYLGRGQAYYSLEKYAAGQNDFNKAIELNKKFSDPQAEISIKSILNRASNQEMAQAYLFRSLIMARRLGMLSKENELEPAAKDAMEAVELDPKLADEYLTKTQPMLKDDRQKYGAFALLKGVAGTQPKNTRVLLQLAQAQKLTFHTKEAIATYTQLLALDPKSVVALRGRADVIVYSSVPYKTAEWLPAVADWKSVLLLSPNDANALANLAFAQYNAEQTANGIATSRQLLKLDATKPYAHILLGVGLAINGDMDGAITEVRDWIDKVEDEEIDKAARVIGGAKTHYPANEVLPIIFKLVPEKEEEEENDNPYFV